MDRRNFAFDKVNFILLAIGDQWVDSIPLLQILCLSGAFMPLYTIYQHLFLSMGKSGIFMWLNLGQIAIMLIAVLACRSLGITAMVIAFACIAVLWLLAWQVFAHRLIGYRFVSMLRDLLPFMLIALAVTGISISVRTTSTADSSIFSNACFPWIASAATVQPFSSHGTLYAMTMKLTRATIFKECIEFISTHLKK